MPLSSESGGLLLWFTRPSDGINYNFISSIYALGAVLSLSLFGLEYVLSSIYLQKEDGEDVEEGSLAEFSRQLEGLHLIFMPFFPCLLWSLFVRSRWSKRQPTKDKNA